MNSRAILEAIEELDPLATPPRASRLSNEFPEGESEITSVDCQVELVPIEGIRRMRVSRSFDIKITKHDDGNSTRTRKFSITRSIHSSSSNKEITHTSSVSVSDGPDESITKKTESEDIAVKKENFDELIDIF